MRFTKTRLLLVALSVMALFITTTISSAADEAQPTTQPTVTPAAPLTLKPLRNNCKRLFTQKSFIKYAVKVYFRDTVSKKAARHMRFMVRCQHSPKAERKMRVVRRALKADRTQRLRTARLSATLTPFHCGSMGNFAIPCNIVACESKGSWTAYNPSGARGPYQLLGWKVPWPVRSEADKVAHHRMAARVWNGGAGRSNWVC